MAPALPGGHRLSLLPVKDSRRNRLRQLPGGWGVAGGLEGIGRGQGFRQPGEGAMGPFQAEGAAWAMTQHLRASSNGQGRPEHLRQVWGVAGGRRKKKKEGEGGRKRERKE